MRKSMIATAVVATATLAASANAGFWSISGANYANGGVNNLPVSSLQNQVSNATSGLGGAVSTQTTISQAQAQTVLSTLGVSLSGNTMTYFGWESSTTGPGYFGVAFRNTSGSSYTLNMQTGSFSSTGSQGVLTTHAGTVGATDWDGTVTVTNNTTMLIMFGGVSAGVSFDMQAQSLNGTTTGASFAIDYLSWNGASYSSVASTATAFTSGLNTAMYAVPVPAPALLAGAGLVGAAALRRRMAKKA